MSNLSILRYIGSKRTDIQYFEMYFPKKIYKVVEPFGGSGYVSLYLFSQNNNIKCHVNDNDEDLINFFKQMKKQGQKIINACNKLIISTTKKEFEHLKKSRENIRSKFKRAVMYLFFNKFYGFVPNMYPENENILEIDYNKYDTFKKWLNNTQFTCLNYSSIFTKYKTTKNIFMFIDPPYFNSFNASYDDFKHSTTSHTVDNTQMYIDIIDYFEIAKCKCMLILNKNAITSRLFKNFIVGEYDKIYQTNKKHTKHLIITDYLI